jgi:hypothetical protein
VPQVIILCYAVHKIPNSVVSLLTFLAVFCDLYAVSVYGTQKYAPLGRPRRRWEDGIRMDLREIGLEGVDWIRLSQDRDRWRAVVNAVMNLRVLAPRS